MTGDVLQFKSGKVKEIFSDELYFNEEDTFVLEEEGLDSEEFITAELGQSIGDEAWRNEE